MKTVIMPRYMDSPARIQAFEPGRRKILATGAWAQITEGHTLDAEDFAKICGEVSYDELVTDVDDKFCIFVAVEHSEPARIQT